MRHPLIASLLALAALQALGPAPLHAQDEKQRSRCGETIDLFKKNDPNLEKFFGSAIGYAIFPSVGKGAFIVGGKYGKGFLSCRNVGKAGWSAPAAIRVEGGSVGFQIGGSETDVVMLVMNESGSKKLISSQFTLGGEGSVAAGPVGRTATAETDAFMRAEVLSWSRSRGVFAGISLQGATLRQDEDDNRDLYGKRLTTEEVVRRRTPPPAAARLMKLLTRFSPREKS